MSRFIPIALRSLLLAAFVVVGAPAASSADENPGEKSDASADEKRKRALALEVMDLTGANDVGDGLAVGLLSQIRPVYPTVPEELWNELAGAFSARELIDLALPIYMRNFSEQELSELVEFYKSRLGRTIIERMPIVMHESNAAINEWNESKLMEIYEKLKAKGYEPGT